MPEAWRSMRRAEQRLRGACDCVAGVDEAGRGPLAGPVVAAAVILDAEGDWAGLNDSKQMRASPREVLFALVLQRARAVRWSVMGPRVIDTVNIRRASLTAMQHAVSRLRVTPGLVLVDGVDRIPGVELPQHPVIDGDATMLSIAAASVVAKVVRDRIMQRLDAVWPAYGFKRHKGYGTPEHLEALARLGPCPLHRYSFAPVSAQQLRLV